MKLQDILDAAQKAGTEGKPPTPKQRSAAIATLLSEADDRSVVEALQAEAAAGFADLDATNPTEPAELLGMELLTDVAEACLTRIGDFDKIDADRAEATAKLRDRMSKVTTPGDAAKADDADKDKADADKPDADKPAEGDTTVADADAAQKAADADKATLDATVVDPAPAAATNVEVTGGGGGAGGTVEAAPADDPALVASARPVAHFNLGAVPKADIKREDAAADKPATVLVAAGADVKGFGVGQNLPTIEALTAAAAAKFSAMPANGSIEGAHIKSNIATIRYPYGDQLMAQDKDDTEVILHAVNQSRLMNRKTGQGGSLVAAGGWCAPSETLYDLSPLLADASAGLVDVPDIGVKRGGIRTTEGADFRTIWAGGLVGQVQTEAQAEAGDLKTVYRVPCTTFTEKRADVVYTGVEAGILQNDAYPELTVQHVEGAMAVHAHKINSLTIARMVTLAGTAVDLSDTLGPSATGGMLNGAEMQITDYRYGYRAPESLLLEVIIPIWAKTVLRSDIALRTGQNLETVTDQQINALFAARGARVQWVYDWQDAFSGVAAGFGAATPIELFPTSVNVLIYAAGTFVRGRGEVVSLDAVYDSTNIKENDFLRLFVEEKLLVHKRQYHARNVKLPLAVAGTTGGSVYLDPQGKPQALPAAA